MLLRKIIIGLLSFYTFEIKRHSRNLDLSPLCETQIERQISTRKKKEIERKKSKRYDKRKWKKKKPYLKKNLKSQGTNPKDLRFSDQQKLRRMYRST